MEISNIIDLILSQGIWCAMFIYFQLDGNKKNDEREKRYIEQIRESAKREDEYQKIIAQQNTEIIPTLKEIKEALGGE